MKFFIFCFAAMLLSNSGYSQDTWVCDTITIGGIQQVIATKGADAGPIILFLHGGPGSSRMKQADIFSNQLQAKFLVVQWDQRESGRTLQLNKTDHPISLELMVADTRELIDTLLNRFHKKKLYLAGESWGTVLGFEIAEKYPELLHAYLAFSPVTDQVKSEKMLLSRLMEDAKKKDNTTAKNQLSVVKIPFENYEQLYYLRMWWFSYDGHPIADKDSSFVRDYLKSWSNTWLPTWQQAMKRNLFTELPAVKCPTYFFLGGKDYQTNCELAKMYYKQLSAPKKNMYWFESASHDILISEAPQVQKIVINEILEN
ncbi:alpha/beta fold hydrolase [Chitinophaga defluvii]|uniref:Alpha/beta hydrolase n=1 Tax=Chitinophaga defluvii TaxID=3163343 RepID=A0ABV2TBD4_9BACT